MRMQEGCSAITKKQINLEWDGIMDKNMTIKKYHKLYYSAQNALETDQKILFNDLYFSERQGMTITKLGTLQTVIFNVAL